MLYKNLCQWIKVSTAKHQQGRMREETALGSKHKGELKNNKEF
jgi:hypothetical protein